jgi:hypothetical protein
MNANLFGRFLDLNVIIPVPLTQILDGQAVDAVPLMGILNGMAASVNANAAAIGSTTPQWVPTGQTPTFINATSFSVPGNQVSTFLPGSFVGMRIQTINTAGTAYHYVTAATFGGGVTTVTGVGIAGGAFDSGLNTVNVSILGPSSGVTTPANALPQRSVLEVTFTHNTDTIVSGAGNGKVFGTNNGNTVSVSYGDGGLAFSAMGGEFNSATGVFTPKRAGWYMVGMNAEVNTTGVTFSGACQMGNLSGGSVAGYFNLDFCPALQANRAFASGAYIDYFSSSPVMAFGIVMTFSVGTPVLTFAQLTLYGPL